MTEALNRNNVYFQRVLDILHAKLNYFPKKLVIQLFERILSKDIILEEIDGKKEINLRLLTDVPQSFWSANTVDIINGKYLKSSITQEILSLVEKYIEIEMTSVVAPDVPEYAYRDTMKTSEHNDATDSIKYESELKLNEILPNDQYIYASLIRNLEVNIHASHLFNYALPVKGLRNQNTIQRVRLKVMGEVEEFALPITYRIECPTCRNVAIFTEMDTTRKIYCTHNTHFKNNPNAAVRRGIDHEFTKLTTKSAEKSITLKGYMAETQNDEGNWIESENLFYSMVPLENTIQEVELIQHCTVNGSAINSSSFYIILSVNQTLFTQKLDKEVFGEIKGKTFLDQIQNGLVEYCREHHGMNVRSDNRYIGQINLFLMLANKIHNRKFYAFIVGTSGSGKTFWSELLTQLLPLTSTTFNGAQVTKNRFMGGDGSVKSISGTSTFQKGIVGTHDFIVGEEATNALDMFHITGGNKTANLFSMIKITSGEFVPITSQGTAMYPSKASLILLGNIEQLQNHTTYLKKVVNMVKKKDLAFKYKSDWPRYRPLEYYLKQLESPLVANSHYEVRRLDEEYVTSHYVTKLPPAEMARFHFFVMLEADREEEFTDFRKGVEKLGTVHMEQIWTEITKRLKVIDMKTENRPEYNAFFDEIYNYLFKEFFQQRQNFRLTKGNINTHVKNNIYLIAKSFFVMQKHWFDQPLSLTREDKDAFEFFMRFNYNTLSEDEARMERRPYFNDYSTFDETHILNNMVETDIHDEERRKAEEEAARAQQEAGSGGEVTDKMSDKPVGDDIFGNMDRFS